MHCLKRTVATPVLPSEGDEAYTALRNNLSRAKVELSAALDAMHKSERVVRRVVTSAATFSTAVAKFSGDNPTLSTRLTQTATDMEALASKADSEPTTGAPDAPVASLIRRVKTFISEIEAVEKEYAKVAAVNKEHELYKKKVNALEKKKEKVGGDKLGRNYEKLEKAKAAHQGVLDSVKAQMDKLWAQQADMYEALFVAYWLGVDTGLKAAVDGMSVPRGYARERQAAVVAKATEGSAVTEMHGQKSS